MFGRRPKTLDDIKPRVRAATLGQRSMWLEGVGEFLAEDEVPICYAAYEPVGPGFDGAGMHHVAFLTNRHLHWRAIMSSGSFTGPVWSFPHEVIVGVGRVKNKRRELALLVRPHDSTEDLLSFWACRDGFTAKIIHDKMIQALELTVGRPLDVRRFPDGKCLLGEAPP